MNELNVFVVQLIQQENISKYMFLLKNLGLRTFRFNEETLSQFWS